MRGGESATRLLADVARCMALPLIQMGAAPFVAIATARIVHLAHARGATSELKVI